MSGPSSAAAMSSGKASAHRSRLALAIAGVVGATAAVGVVAVLMIGGNSPSPSVTNSSSGGHEIAGVLRYSGEAFANEPGMDRCIGQMGTPFYGLQTGVEVLLEDERGVKLGVDRLTELPTSGSAAHPVGGEWCEFGFHFSAVPDAMMYSVLVGGRQGPTYTRAELEGSGWAMSLGG